MANNEFETPAPYTVKEFGKDLTKATAQTAVEFACAAAILLAVGYGYSKWLDRKAAKAAQQES